MLKLILILAIVLQTGLIAAQDIVLAAISERTVTGPQFGGSLTYETGKKWGMGVFYQAEIGAMGNAEDAASRLYGGLLQAPLMISEKINFVANLRVGLANEKFIVAIPALETRLNVTKRTGVSFEMSMRMSYPSLSGKLFIRLF